MDNGGNGLAVVQELLTLDKYRDLQLEGRLRGYDFGCMTRLAVRDGKEVRKRTKEFMTSLINGALQRRQAVFPVEDLEIEDQFTTHTFWAPDEGDEEIEIESRGARPKKPILLTEYVHLIHGVCTALTNLVYFADDFTPREGEK